MKATRWSYVLFALILASMVGGQPRAGEVLTLASGPENSKAFVAGIGLASLIKVEVLPRRKIDIQTLASAGAVDNVRRLQAGEAQFAILPSTVGHAARTGSGSFAGDPPETGFRAIATLWRDALHLVMHADHVATGTIDDLRRLKDGRMFEGDVLTGMADANRLLLADLGLASAKALKPAGNTDGDYLTAIERGEIDAFSAAFQPPEARLAALLENRSAALRLLDVTEQQMTRANGNHWLWTPYVIPAATYPGQNEDIWTIALSNMLVARADVDVDIVHAITESVFENLPYLHRIDPVMADLRLDDALDGMAIPLHPGALRYYRAAGLISEPRTIPPDPRSTPIRDAERYPDGDVAGDWMKGKGGPLLETPPPEPTPHWRRRATL